MVPRSRHSRPGPVCRRRGHLPGGIGEQAQALTQRSVLETPRQIVQFSLIGRQRGVAQCDVGADLAAHQSGRSHLPPKVMPEFRRRDRIRAAWMRWAVENGPLVERVGKVRPLDVNTVMLAVGLLGCLTSISCDSVCTAAFRWFSRSAVPWLLGLRAMIWSLS